MEQRTRMVKANSDTTLRAGEQGLGFAVVADATQYRGRQGNQGADRRQHQPRSAPAARWSPARAQTMQNIVAEVREVSALIQEIGSASHAQRRGIGQVVTAVSQLDHVTQQNAALVEESAAAAQSLGDQAARRGVAPV